MGSIISWLRKVQDGQVFAETFENPQFFTAEGWVTLQGKPYLAQSSTVAFDNSIFSFSCGLDLAAVPVMKKVLPAYSVPPYVSANAINNQMVVGWFYDDMTTTGNGPYLKASDNNGNYLQVGVRNGISTTKYAINQPATLTADQFAASTVTRTLGWHKFALILNATIGGLTIYIDGVLVGTYTPASISSSWANVFVCANIVGDTTTSFGYFDDIGVYSDINTYVYLGNTTRTCYSYTDTPAVLSGPTSTSPLFAVNLQNYSNTTGFPINVSFQISQNGLPGNMALQSVFQPTNPGDVWILEEVDLPYRFKTYSPTDKKLTEVNVSNRGATESLFYGQKNQLVFVSQPFDGTINYAQFEEFMEWIGQGYPFSVMLDSNAEGFFGILAADLPVGSTSMNILPELTNGMGIIGGGLLDGFYVIRSADYVKKQVVTLSSSSEELVDNEGDELTDNEGDELITNPLLVTTTPTKYPFEAGDYIFPLWLYPFMEMMQPQDAMPIDDFNIPRFSWSFPAREYEQ